MQNSLIFPENGKLRIMVVSDPQDLKFVRPTMCGMLGKAYDDYKPDLVLFNGDNILGNHLLDARFGSRKVAEGREATFDAMKKALDKVLEPVNSRKIPFAMVYGNHDDMNELTKEEQIEIYRGYEYCMPMNTDDKSVDCDTYAITLNSACGKPLWAVYMLDSAWQDENGCHTEIKPETVSWFKSTAEKLKKENGGAPLPGIALMHIPLPAINSLLMPCGKDDANAIKCDDGVYKKLNPVIAKGFMLEPPSIVETDNGLFDTMKQNTGVKAVVFGHDHSNCFEGSVDGIKILQTGAASFRCYGNINTKGVRIIDLDESGTFTSEFLTYYDIMGETPLTKVKYFWDADEYAYKKYISLGVAAISAVSIAAVKTAKAIIKKRR